MNKNKRHRKARKNNANMCSSSCIYFHQCVEPSKIEYEIIDGCKHAINSEYYCLYNDKTITSWKCCKHKKEYSDINIKLFKNN